LEGDADAEAAAYNDLGLAYFQQSVFLEARKHFHRAHLMAKSIGSEHGIAVSLHLLARVDVAEGRIDDGVARYREVLRIASEGPHGDLEAGTLHRLGVVAMDRNNRVDAAKLFHRALDLRERLENLAGQADTLGELAELHRRQGELRTAEDYVSRALSLHMRTRDQAVAARACEVLAMIRRDRGDLTQATYCARRAVELHDRVGNSKSKAEALVLLGELRWAAKAHAAASEAWEQAFKIFEDAGDPRAAAVAARLDPFDGERTVPTARNSRWSPRWSEEEADIGREVQ
jgi:tetratricopeptide (TPR) repeat protein